MNFNDLLRKALGYKPKEKLIKNPTVVLIETVDEFEEEIKTEKDISYLKKKAEMITLTIISSEKGLKSRELEYIYHDLMYRMKKVDEYLTTLE